jgi:hypothetical protein
MPKKKKKPMMEMEMVEEKAAMRAYGDVYQDEEHDVQENDEEDMDEEDEMPGEEKMYGMMP